jgi:excisionase family DNA binding protein
MTVREAAERLGVSAQTVYQLCAARKLRHVRIGLGRGTVRISEEAIAEYLRRAEGAPDAAPAPPRRAAFKHVRLPGP